MKITLRQGKSKRSGLVTHTGGGIRVKLRVSSPPGECTLVEGSGPVSAGVRCALHYRFLALLTAAEWEDWPGQTYKSE